MVEEISYITSGVLFGVAAGFMPSPLTTLVITETLRHNKRQGAIVAAAPVITDVPILLVSLFVLARLSEFNAVLGAISLLGALFLSRLALDTFTARGVELNLEDIRPDSLKKGIITNFLNPNPYLFWATVGGPIVMKGCGVSWFAVAGFLGAFFFFVVVIKMLLAVIVEHFKSFMTSKAYAYILRGMGIMLLAFAALFFRDGLRLLGAM